MIELAATIFCLPFILGAIGVVFVVVLLVICSPFILIGSICKGNADKKILKLHHPNAPVNYGLLAQKQAVIFLVIFCAWALVKVFFY